MTLNKAQGFQIFDLVSLLFGERAREKETRIHSLAHTDLELILTLLPQHLSAVIIGVSYFIQLWVSGSGDR